MTANDGLLVGERTVNLEGAFNIREGLVKADDSLPDGPAKGRVVDLKPMIDHYYELRGWDVYTGIPSREKLTALGLDKVVDKLEDYR